MRAFRRIKRENERGANLVEFALVIPLLLLMLVGVADLGRAFRTYIAITNAAREGARFASRLPAAEVQIKDAAIEEAALSGLALSADDIAIGNLGGEGGTPITVTVTYDFPLILGGLLGLPGGTLTLRNEAVMVIFGLE